MIVLLDTSHDLDACAVELDCPTGQLLTPLTRYRLRDPDKPWAIDNGGYKRLEIAGLNALLTREAHHKDACKFVTVPDIVGSAQRTLELFDHFRSMLSGWKLAFACQDGQENVPIPWTLIDAVFIGGTTNWKCGPHVVNIIKVAQVLGKWTHVGRLNSPGRFEHFHKLGVDSADGTGLARYSHMREAIAEWPLQEALL